MESVELRDYSFELEHLERLINNVQSSVYFTITIIVAILALAVGISGWALAVLAKKWVNDKVEGHIKDIKDDNESFKSTIDSKILEMIIENPQFKWVNGNITPLSKEFQILLPTKKFRLDYPTKINIYPSKGTPLTYELELISVQEMTGVKVSLTNYEAGKHGGVVYYEVMWEER